MRLESKYFDARLMMSFMSAVPLTLFVNFNNLCSKRDSLACLFFNNSRSLALRGKLLLFERTLLDTATVATSDAQMISLSD